jgi:biofilm PGA synthesis N-glycosyltransferase PgaC
VTSGLRYSIVTPVRNEAENLGRLREVLEAQTHRPLRWVIVDTGSDDETPILVRELAAKNHWIDAEELPAAGGAERGAPIVRAFHHGLAHVPDECELVVKLDADISLAEDHFERLVREFERDERVGIAGGVAYQLARDGVWRLHHSTGLGIRGAARAYRRACLNDVLPLEERMGWDTLDLVKAETLGWKVLLLRDLPFRHHRDEAERDPSSYFRWRNQGAAAWYMGYRWSYVLARTLFRMRADPAAFGILHGYVAARLRREQQCPDPAIRRSVRRRQRLRELPRRVREAAAPRRELAAAPLSDAGDDRGSARRDHAPPSERVAR